MVREMVREPAAMAMEESVEVFLDAGERIGQGTRSSGGEREEVLTPTQKMTVRQVSAQTRTSLPLSGLEHTQRRFLPLLWLSLNAEK